MSKTNIFAALVLSGGLILTGCTGTDWATSYNDTIDAEVAKTWRVSEIDVKVPRSLSVSEANSFAPNADIVWRELPYADRYDQVDAIITEAASRGTAELMGDREVKLVITMQQFHALSEKARAVLRNSGVHDINFTAQVFDIETNEPLTPLDTIAADLIAYVGDEAIEAEIQGLTQKVRITSHVAAVIAGWFGTGADVRGTFKRNGR